MLRTMHYGDQLTARISLTSPVCVGLDPILSKLPEGISKDAEGVFQFAKAIIDQVHETAAVVKPQLAYYEVLGWEGLKAFWATCAYAKDKGMMVIADAKRGDIGPTAAAYAEAYLFEDSPVDAITVNPYLGSDGVLPFIELAEKNGKGVYVLVKTSNDSSGELQDLPVGDEAVHEHLAQLVESWGMHHIGPETNLSFVGAVVGATYPEELKYLRTIMPHLPFLIPGYGAQGGTADDVKRGFLPDGTGAVVNASRSIIFASDGKDFAEAAGRAAAEMAEALTGKN
jgi:orotidine-5'-phosphate decarboxylase